MMRKVNRNRTVERERAQGSVTAHSALLCQLVRIVELETNGSPNKKYACQYGSSSTRGHADGPVRHEVGVRDAQLGGLAAVQ
jgi:hypothetical protein